MRKAPELREIPDLPDEIAQAGLNGDLVLFVGAGVSVLLGLPSWVGLASEVLQWLRSKKFLNYSELEQLRTLDPKKQLSIANLIAIENGQKLELSGYFKGKSEGTSIYKTINDIGCVCVTTNYDELLTPRYLDVDDGSKAPAAVNRVCHKKDFLAKHLDEPGSVIHLHGGISHPETMVITTKDYLEHYDDPNVKHFLGELFASKTVLFIGYGLEESEILEHILRRGGVKTTADRRRFVLQGYFRSQQPLYDNIHRYYENSFGVHVIGFVRDHEDYLQQENLLRDWASRIKVNRPPLARDMELMNKVLGNG